MTRPLPGPPCVALLALLLAAPVEALDREGEAARQAAAFDRLVSRMIEVMRANITMLKLPNGTSLAPETAAEKKREIIPFALGREVVRVGQVSAMAEWCGLAWREKNFEPMMRQLGDSGRLDARQLVFAGGLHGLAMAEFGKGFRETGACEDAHRARAARALLVP